MNSEITPTNDAAVNERNPAGLWEGFAVIHATTRAELLECGDLIDASAQAATVGLRLPLAVSIAAWNAAIIGSPEEQPHCLLRLLMHAKIAAAAAQNSNTACFDFDGRGLYLHCGPGDCSKPVLTIMVQGED